MTTEPLWRMTSRVLMVAAGLVDLVGVDGEDFAFVGEFGGDEAGLFGDGWGSFGWERRGLGLAGGFGGLGGRWLRASLFGRP